MLIYLIRPRASLSCRLERWPLGIYFTEVVAEFFGEAFDDFRVTGAKVVLFADIVGDVEQFFLAGTVIVNQFPVAIADRTVEVDARTVVAPVVRHIPEEGTPFGRIARPGEQRNEADAVDRLHRLVVLHSGHFQDSRVEVFYQQVFVATGIRLGYSRPTDDHRFADTPFAKGTFAAQQRIVLRVQRAVTPFGRRGKAAVIAHEEDDRIVCLPVLFQPVHQIAQALVHPFDQGGVGTG